jgi:hypothetical protein
VKLFHPYRVIVWQTLWGGISVLMPAYTTHNSSVLDSLGYILFNEHTTGIEASNYVQYATVRA